MNTRYKILVDGNSVFVVDENNKLVSSQLAVRLIKSLITTYGLGIESQVPAMVYLLYSDKTDLYKIGMTSQNIEARLSAIKYNENDHAIVLIATIKCPSVASAYELEGLLHRFYESSRIDGEWFQLADSDVRFFTEEKYGLLSSRIWSDNLFVGMMAQAYIYYAMTHHNGDKLKAAEWLRQQAHELES